MKDAVVIGARQILGFELCEQLLEFGYTVYASDFSQWQNETHLEKWLFIGRNANLHYMNLDDHNIKDVINEKVNKNCYIFIPLTDFYAREIPEINVQFTNQLKQLILDDTFLGCVIVFLTPSEIDRKQSTFSSEVEQLKDEMKNYKLTMIDYCIPQKNSKKSLESLYYRLNGDQKLEKYVLDQDQIIISNSIITHLERTLKLLKDK